PRLRRPTGMEHMSPSQQIDPYRLLLSAVEARDALGIGVSLEESKGTGQIEQLGNLLGTAAVGTAFRSYAGRALDGEDAVPVQVGSMALVFASDSVARRTFDQVAQASHLRTKLGKTDVSVETVTA